jgi:hypothetical protein
MRTIWKYVLNLGATDLSLPKGAKILTADVQYDAIALWAIVDPEAEREPRRFVIFGTGHPVTVLDERLIYVNTIQLQRGQFIGHIFEVIA